MLYKFVGNNTASDGHSNELNVAANPPKTTSQRPVTQPTPRRPKHPRDPTPLNFIYTNNHKSAIDNERLA
jgi:hypothetical protein